MVTTISTSIKQENEAFFLKQKPHVLNAGAFALGTAEAVGM